MSASSSVPFQDAVQILRRWVDDHGGVYPSRSTVVPYTSGAGTTAFSLGNWVMNRRAEQRAGRLGAAEAARLATVPGWPGAHGHTNPFPGRSALGYIALLRYAALSYHACPEPELIFEDYPLGRWVERRRRDFTAGRLTAAQRTALERLPGWVWEPGAHADVMVPAATMPWIHLRALLELLSAHGRLDRSVVAEHAGAPTRAWVERLIRDHHAGVADPSLVMLMAAMPGWDWSHRPAPTHPPRPALVPAPRLRVAGADPA